MPSRTCDVKGAASLLPLVPERCARLQEGMHRAVPQYVIHAEIMQGAITYEEPLVHPRR